MKKYLLQFVVINSILLGSIAANAQMVGTDVFLKGNYVEVGIGGNGSYGSTSAAPAGYHPHECCGSPLPTPGAHLGFVADPAMDGWATGTPAYMGDYFLPGSPFEGWELQVDSSRCQGYGGGGIVFSGAISGSGSNMSYAASGSTITTTWQGMIDSIQFSQITSLDTNALYFTVKIILTNMAVTPKDNIYYWRSVDPDNDETWPGGSFSTDNVVEHQSRDTTVVSAAGHSSPLSYLALGTTDTAATAVVYNAWGLSVGQDLSAVYNGTYAALGAWYDVGVNHPGDIGIGLVMYVPHLATVDSAGDSVYRTTAISTRHPANTATISYFYAFSKDAVDSAIKALRSDTATGTTGGSGGTPTLGVKNVNNTPEIKVYPNPAKNSINVTGLGASDQLYLYDMMGRTVNQNWTVGNKNVNTFSLNGIPAGAYILMVQDANGHMKARMPIRKQ